MTPADFEPFLELSRRKTLELLDHISKQADPRAILSWRPGPGRAHLAWQFMHVAATEDRHVHVRMKGGEAKEPELVRRFAGGSTPDDDIPDAATIRRYLDDRRQELLAHMRTLSAADLERKPNEAAQWNYRDWFQILTWHEGHHHGQAHITFNLYRAAQAPTLAKVGH